MWQNNGLFGFNVDYGNFYANGLTTQSLGLLDGQNGGSFYLGVDKVDPSDKIFR